MSQSCNDHVVFQLDLCQYFKLANQITCIRSEFNIYLRTGNQNVDASDSAAGHEEVINKLIFLILLSLRWNFIVHASCLMVIWNLVWLCWSEDCLYLSISQSCVCDTEYISVHHCSCSIWYNLNKNWPKIELESWPCLINTTTCNVL